ncbi:MAG: sulfur transferase domain-containing protein [Holophaga sp.]
MAHGFVVSSLLWISITSPFAMQAQALPVVKLEGHKDVFQHGRVFVAGQPNLDLLRTLKAQGVTLVVNLRDEKEMKDHAATAFQEEALVKELGMDYLWIPLGEKASYTPTALERFGLAEKVHPGKILLHCASGGRASIFYIAHLARHRGQNLNEAVAVGKQMKFVFPLEDLLGSPLAMTMKDGK